MRIHFVQHVSFESPAFIERWATERGFAQSFTRVFENAGFPASTDIDALVIMGGPMSAYDDVKYDWLSDEKRLIDDCIKTGKKVLGVCLGAQLIASVLGGKVFPAEQKEIGWFPSWLTEAGKESSLLAGISPEFTPFHWHGDTFDLPKGASLLASSECSKHQAFSLGTTVLALQFHLEMGRAEGAAMLENCRHELRAGKFVQTADQISSRLELFDANEQMCRVVLENFFVGPK